MAGKKQAGRDRYEVFATGDDPALNEVPKSAKIQIIRSEDGRLAVIPSSVAKLTGEKGNVVADIQEQVQLLAREQQRLDELIGYAREVGVTWSAIGWCVGLTTQGAQQRWSD